MLKESANNQLEYQRLSQEEMEKRGILGRLVGVCADFFSPTRNGRKYPEKLWENVFSDPIMKERIENGVCYGELGHPADREETDMEKIALCLAEVPKKGKDGKLRAVFDILNTPNGRILKSLCDYGSTIGISSRGSGDLETDYDGNESVNPDTYNCEGFDAVLIPAVKEARLEYVTESLNKKRYNKTLRDKLTESINKEDENNQKIMRESLNTLGIKLDESRHDGGMNTYPIEYSYSKETDDSLDRFYGHINVKATSEEEAIQKADEYLHSVEFENKNDISNINNIHIGDTEYTNADLLDEASSDLQEDKSVDFYFSNERPEYSEEPVTISAVNLSNLNKDDLYEYLESLAKGSEILDVYGAWESSIDLENGETPKPLKLEKHVSIKQNYYAPTPTKYYQSYWKLNGSERSIYDIVSIIEGSNRYYFVSDGKSFPKFDSDRKVIIESNGHAILGEDLNVNDEELSLIVKYLESELGHTWTDISDEKKIRQLLNKIHQYNASLFNTPAADDDGAIVEELQNTLNENEKLKKQIIELQEKLSVCYAKEANLTEANMRRNDTISKLSTQTKKTKALNEKYNSLEAQFNENLNTLSKDRLKIKILEDNSESLKKTNSKLKEDLRGKFKEVSSLNEKLAALENKAKAKDKKHANEIASINEQLENSNKDLEQLKETYSKKLDNSNKLIEKYKRMAKGAVNRYIESQATKLGIDSKQIKSRLSESYTFSDIDRICEELQEYSLNMSRLPFNASRSNLSESIQVRATGVSKNNVVPANPDDDITDYDLKIAGLV